MEQINKPKTIYCLPGANQKQIDLFRDALNNDSVKDIIISASVKVYEIKDGVWYKVVSDIVKITD